MTVDYNLIVEDRKIETMLVDRLTETESGCWDWKLKLDKFGYGNLHYKHYSLRAHKLSYIIFKGAIPDGLIVRHKCDRPSCSNPDHLELGTYKDNSQDQLVRDRRSVSKITYFQAHVIKYLMNYGNIEQGHIGQVFGYIGTDRIREISTGESWSSVPENDEELIEHLYTNYEKFLKECEPFIDFLNLRIIAKIETNDFKDIIDKPYYNKLMDLNKHFMQEMLR